MNSKKSNPQAYWKPGFLLPLLFATFLLLPDLAISRESTFIKSTTNHPNIRNNGAQTDMKTGYWYSSREGNNYCFLFKGNKEHSSWNMSRCFASSLFQKKENTVFEMVQETGTLQLAGNLDAGVCQGKYTFIENAAFQKCLADNNITSTNQNLLFRLFFGNINKAYVQFLKKQYHEVSGKQLLDLAAHGISLDDFQGYITLFKKYNNKQPSIAKVVDLRIHGINETYVQELQRLGYVNLSLEKIIEAKIHDVSAAYIESLSRAGFNKLPIDKTIEAKIHGVKADYISDLKAVGFENLPIDQVIEAKIHGLNPATVKDLKTLGYKDLTFRDMISAQIHGANVAYVKDLQQAGFQNLTMDKTIEARKHGVNGNFIKEAREQGYKFSSIDKYISLKIHGLAMKSSKD